MLFGMSVKRARRLSELDLLRFAAALSVVLFHCDYHEHASHLVTQFGFMGVHVFFMISGFVILWTALKKDTYEFLASRVSRLYPSFWIGVLLTFAALCFVGGPVSAKQLLANLSMVPSMLHEPNMDSVYWTLQIELKFYAIFLLLIVTRQLANIETWLLLWLGICALSPSWLHGLTLGGYAPLFAAGCFLYLIYSHGTSRLRTLGLFACFVEGAIQVFQAQAGFTNIDALYAQCTTVAILAAAFVVFFLIAARRTSLPESPVWYWLGSMTYPLYLVHNVAAAAVTHFMPHAWWHEAARIGVALAVAAALAMISERKLCPKFDQLLLRARQRVREMRARQPLRPPLIPEIQLRVGLEDTQSRRLP
jgi:peptidoglycan/LPS O-acetylase OafA/YrhL